MATPNSREPLLRYLTTQLKLDGELVRILREAATDTERRIRRTKSIVEGSQLASLLADIRKIQHELWITGVARAVTRRLRDAVQAADRAARGLDEFLANAVGERRAAILTGAFSRQLERGLELDATRVPHRLSDLVYRNRDLWSGRIERIIRAGVIRGFSARQIAEQVRPTIDPRVRGGVSHAAMRLGRTELNNAFHQRQIAQADRSWVTGVQWNLSKSHPKPDLCDEYAAHDEGLGSGVWDKMSVPDKPHPQCMCYLTYELLSPEQAVQMIVAQTA